MDAVDIVKSSLRAWEANEAATLSSLLSDDFTFGGPVPRPLNKAEFIGFMQAVLAVYPNFRFNENSIREQGGIVSVSVSITGTSTGSLSLPGLPSVSATGEVIASPVEVQHFRVSDGKITAAIAELAPGGIIPKLLAQLGIQM
jgi:hypothetical protein